MKKCFFLLSVWVLLVATASAVTVIRKLPYVISKPGKYVFSGDVTAPDKAVPLPGLGAVKPAILVQANNVEVDLAGFSLLFNGDAANPLDTAFEIMGASQVRIHNGSIRNFNLGVVCASPVSDVTLEDLAVSVAAQGLSVFGEGFRVRRCTVHLANVGATGIGLGSSGLNNLGVLEHCTVTGTGAANLQVGVSAISGAIVRACNFAGLGTGVQGGTGVTVADNLFSSCTNKVTGSVNAAGYNQ